MPDRAECPECGGPCDTIECALCVGTGKRKVRSFKHTGQIEKDCYVCKGKGYLPNRTTAREDVSKAEHDAACKLMGFFKKEYNLQMYDIKKIVDWINKNYPSDDLKQGDEKQGEDKEVIAHFVTNAGVVFKKIRLPYPPPPTFKLPIECGEGCLLPDSDKFELYSTAKGEAWYRSI